MISVITQVYNNEKYLRQEIGSALVKDESGEEIIIEDNSPDNILMVCKELEDEYPSSKAHASKIII